jgi:hypothetical protein
VLASMPHMLLYKMKDFIQLYSQMFITCTKDTCEPNTSLNGKNLLLISADTKTNFYRLVYFFSVQLKSLTSVGELLVVEPSLEYKCKNEPPYFQCSLNC